MPSFLEEYPHRTLLTSELHARPYAAIGSPARLVYLGMQTTQEDKKQIYTALVELCALFSIMPPASQTDFFHGDFGRFALRYESHTEFSGYCIIAPFDAKYDLFKENLLDYLPKNWLESLPGKLVIHTHFEIVPEISSDVVKKSNIFHRGSLCSAKIVNEARIYTDFRLHESGGTRFLIVTDNLKAHKIGRTVQNALELEIYRTLSLLALPVARSIAPEVTALECTVRDISNRLAEMTSRSDTRLLLHEISGAAANLASIWNMNAYRFAATDAYAALVKDRITLLREENIEDFPTLSQFLDRRFHPAYRTCCSVETRLHRLSERITRLTGLLAAQVNVDLQENNQTLLKSMESRVKLQLRLQETVEGLSVVAITYYALGILNYILGGLEDYLPFSKGLGVALSAPFIFVTMLYSLKRFKRLLRSEEAGDF